MATRTMKTVLAGVTVLAVAGLGSGLAFAQGSDVQGSDVQGSDVQNVDVQGSDVQGSDTTAPSDPAGQAKHRRAFLGRVEHGEFTTHTKTGDQVVDVQRGTVTAVNGQSITVKSADGFSGTYSIDPQSKVRKDKRDITIDQVATNDRVVVFALKNGGTAAAKRIGDLGPAK
ncbi:MAG TPA: hypothetical protein VIY28_12180 [Pseudonocardiaceae bacterium]